MIRFRAEPPGKPPVVFLGLSDENLTRLRAGQPIELAADDEVARLGSTLVIYGGGNEVDLTRELEERGVLPPGSAAKAEQAIRERAESRLK